jgi:putative membrane protein
MLYPPVLLADPEDAHAFWFWPAGWLVVILAVVLVSSCLWWGPWRGYRRWRRYDRIDAVETLRHRYAKGEITKEEFERMKAELRG